MVGGTLGIRIGMLLLAVGLLGCGPAHGRSAANTGGRAAQASRQRLEQARFATPPPAAAVSTAGAPLQAQMTASDELRADGLSEEGPGPGAESRQPRGQRSATARRRIGGPSTRKGKVIRTTGGKLLAQSETPASDSAEAKTAIDGRRGPLLIYQAALWIAVYEVEAKQAEAIAAARELGGFLQLQTSTRLVLRVPADQFEQAMSRVEAVGDVSDRQVRAMDVTDQFRDLRARLANAESVRDRLLALLDQSDDVEKSLAIERELDRLTERIERLKGKLQLLSDRIAYATITIEFGVKPRSRIDPEFQLPFEWLDTLGLTHLLEL
jgi:hypothetical protein